MAMRPPGRVTRAISRSARGRSGTLRMPKAMLMASTERTVRLEGEGGPFLHWGARRIPLDRAGNLLLERRREPRSIPWFSARAVLDGELAADALRGRIVLVGAWATGLGDLHLVPSGRWARGLEVHGAVIETVLGGRFLVRPGWARGAELFAALLLGVASTLLLSRSGFKVSLAVVEREQALAARAGA